MKEKKKTMLKDSEKEGKDLYIIIIYDIKRKQYRYTKVKKKKEKKNALKGEKISKQICVTKTYKTKDLID